LTGKILTDECCRAMAYMSKDMSISLNSNIAIISIVAVVKPSAYNSMHAS